METLRRGQGELNLNARKTSGRESLGVSGRLPFESDRGSITPSFSYSEGSSQKEYPDGIVVDTEGKSLGVAIGGELFLDEDGKNRLRAELSRDNNSNSFEVKQLDKVLDKGSFKDGITRLSLGADLGKFSFDVTTDRDSTSGNVVYRIGKNTEAYIQDSTVEEPTFGINFSKNFNEGGSVDEQTKNAFTRIEDISAQNVPLVAGPDDTVVGFDELGGTVYKSRTGQEYTLYPETKTKQERPIIAAAEAVGEYISDPSLPSLEETSEFAKEAVKGAYEPFRKIASGDSPTYGDLAEVLPAGLSGAATRVGKPLDTSVEDIINAEDFEPLDENFIPVNKPSAESLKSEIDYMLGEELTPQEGLSKIKKTNLEDLGLYKKGTVLGDAALDKDKIFSSLKDEELLKLAEDLPHWEDAKYSDYLKNTLVPVSKKTGADWSNLLETLNDISSYLPTKENPQLAFLTEKPLPKKAPVGERAATGSAPRAADPKAEQLGFLDTVYHTSVSPQEFTEFDPQKGFSGEVRAAQDLLGVHVGTARAAAERNFQAYRKDDTPKGFTMELRARATDPLTKGDLARMFGKAPEDIFSSGDTPLTESDIGEAISFYEDMLFKDKQPPKEGRKIAAVAFRRELAREGFTHIPYINSVEDPGSISYIMLVDRPKDSPAVLRDVRAQFDPKKVTSPDLRFAEGGMVEEDQMNRLMQEGGIADDGMTREPVTGNEIPPGSMASEVRDDIPAQLSEGEYIVPADVVRFFGVRLFEDLRKQAKQGLAEMEASGRIGGTPVNSQGIPAEQEDEKLTPEEQQMLMEALGASGMAYGGMVENQPLSTPYQDQSTLYQMPAGMGGPMGMAEGGVSTFDRTKFTLEDNGLGSGTGIEARKYINPKTKEERTIQFLNGIPLGIIPDGFVPWTQELADAPETDTSTDSGTPSVEVKKEERGGRDREEAVTGEGSTGYQGWAAENFDAITSDPLGFAKGVYADATQPKGTLGQVFGMTGPGKMLGDFQTLSAISNLEAALSRATPGSADATAIQGMIEGLSGTVDTNLAEVALGLGFADGKQRINALDMYEQGRTSLSPTGATGSTSANNAAGVGTSSTKTPEIGFNVGQVDPGLAAAAGIGNNKTSGGGNNKPSGGGAGDSGKIGGLSFDKPSGGTPGGGFGTGGPGNVGQSGSTAGTPGGGFGTGGPGNVGGNRSGGSAGASERSGGAFAPGGLVSKKTAPKKPRKGLAS